MPYKVMMQNGNHAVFKVDESGNPIGKPLGTHKTAKSARSQVSALYANEKKEETTDDVEGKALEELHQKMGYYDEPMPVMMMGGPTSFADLMAQEAAQEAAHEIGELTDCFSDLARNIMASDLADKGAAMTALAGEYAGLIQEKLAGNEKALSVAELIAGENQPPRDDRPDELKAVWTAKYVGSLPDSSFLYVEPNCKNKGCRHFPVKDASGQLDLPHLRNAIARIPQSNAPGLTPEKKTQLQNSARKMLKNAGDNKELFIWKEGETYRWIAAYSNNRRDDDNPPEIISSESHKEFDEALHKGEWPLPELWLWHIPYPVGVTQYHAYDESTGFPVAAGVFNKGFEWAAEGVLEAGWDGVSHGMPAQWIKRDEKDNSILVRHRTKEITFLPPWAAANKLAFNIISKETIMAEEKGLPAHKRDEFIKAFGEERVTEIETVLEGKAKEADDAGIEKKESEPAAEVAPKETLTPDNPVVKALEMVVTQLTALESRLKAIEDKTQQVEAQLVKEEPFDLMEFLKSKSAVGQPTAKVDGRSTLAKDGPEEAKGESFTEKFSGIRVSLVDQLVGANQEYYNNSRR